MKISTKAKCVECSRVFDLLDSNDANEWAYGHDCEVEQVITLIGECMNCGKIYGTKVSGTLESIYNQEETHKCEGKGVKSE